MPTERVAALEELARTSPYWDKKDPPELQPRHDLMRAKLFGFMDRPDAVARRYPLSDTSLPARYARAISAYRFGDPAGALAQIDGLIQAQPQNPYFYELKGQALLEAGKPAEAIAPLRHAVQLAPNPTLIQIMLGQALIATNDKAHADEAVPLLEAALKREPESPDAYTQLAMAYGRKGDLAQADLASAQAAFTRGDLSTARQLAARAKTRFPVGSPGWVKADDIATYKPPAADDKSQLMPTRTMINEPSSACRRRSRRRAGPAVGAACAGADAVVLARPARRDRKDHPRIPDQPSGGAAGGRWPSWRSARTLAEAEKHREARQAARADHLHLAAPGHARQSAGRRHPGRVLRLQLRLLQARPGRHDRPDEERPQAQVRAQGIPGARRRLGEAAQVAVAVRMQDKTGGKKYLDFHQKLLGGRGQADKARALAVAKEVGFDMARLEKDMASDEVKTHARGELQARRGARAQRHAELRRRQRRRDRRGRPPALKEQVNIARCGKATC